MVIITRTLQLALAVVSALMIVVAQANDMGIAALLRSAIDVACTSSQSDLAQMANRLGNTNGAEEKLIKVRGVTIGW